ncbi:MAG: DUF1570 domain-containing protein [Planctomycetaceae bacterium]|jgi:hypothetical protein|nr:DUF1570 domain-containing protein [Planctomycetaceae bacterium]
MTNFSGFNRILMRACFAFAAAFLCVGTADKAAAESIILAGQSPTSKVVRTEDLRDDTPSDEAGEQPLHKFFTSLRFWGKDKMTVRQKPSAATISPVSPVVNNTGSTASKTPPASLLVLPSNAAQTNGGHLNSAPVPPQIQMPLSEMQPASAGEPQTAGTIVPSELPGTARTDSVTSAYTFDSREWVDSYPAHYSAQRVSVPVRQQAVPHNTNVPDTALPDETLPAALLTAHSDDNRTNNNWNGEAVELAALTKSIDGKHTDVQRANNETRVSAVSSASLDLTPTYEQQLPYVAVCGVVVVEADFPLTQMSAILAEINQLQEDLHKYIGVPAPKEKIELCLFKSGASYINFLKQNFSNAPLDRRALFVKADNKPATLMVQKADNFEIDLRHEMTHAIIHASIADVPIWLDEGLAKYFELPAAERADNNPYQKKVVWAAKFGAVPSLNRLTKLETIEDMGSKEYQDSWAWTHFLIHRSPQTHRLLAAYLQMLGRMPVKTYPDRKAKIPPITRYLDDVVSNQREEFRKHYGVE